MYGLFLILLFYLLGCLISALIGNFVPGSVIGMILLFLCLFFKLIKPDMVLDIKDEQQSCRIHLTFPEDAPKDVFYETATGECQ